MAGFRREEGGPATESAVGDWLPAPGIEAADPNAAPCRLQGAVRRRLQLSPREPKTPSGPALRPELRTRTRPFLESRKGPLSPSSPETPRPRLGRVHIRLRRSLFLFIHQI